MSLMRSAGTAIAISGLLLGSTVAQAAAPARQASKVSDSEAVAGGSAFGFVIAALIAVGIALVISSDGTDAPTSP